MVETDVRHAPPGVARDAHVDQSATSKTAIRDRGANRGLPSQPYRTPTLTVYGSVRDLTRGYGQGKPDSGVSHSHSMASPFGGSGPAGR